jgi:hypothetical protein
MPPAHQLLQVLLAQSKKLRAGKFQQDMAGLGEGLAKAVDY